VSPFYMPLDAGSIESQNFGNGKFSAFIVGRSPNFTQGKSRNRWQIL